MGREENIRRWKWKENYLPKSSYSSNARFRVSRCTTTIKGEERDQKIEDS